MKMTSTLFHFLSRVVPLGLLLGILLMPQWLKAQCDPRTSCINQVNVQMDANCKFTVTPGLVGFGACIGTYRVVVSDSNPANGNVIDCPGLWDYAVLNAANEIVCWGKILAEDKSGPILKGTDFSSNATLLCSDVKFVLNNPKTVGPTNTNQSLSGLISGTVIDSDVKNLGIPNFEDNCKTCGCNITLKFSDRLENANCTETIVNGIYARIYRTFVATDCKGMTQSVEQVIVFRRPSLNDFQFDFAGDANYRAIISYDACAANKNQIRRIDVLPYVTNFLGKKVYLDSIDCGYSVSPSDIEFPTCNSGLKIDRTLRVFDWCLGREAAQYKILIKLGDTSPPRITKPSRTPVISTGPSGCTASLSTSVSGISGALGATISDNCQLGAISTKIRTKGRMVSGIVLDTTNWYNVTYPTTNGVITGLTVGRHRLIITANDGCYNTLVDSVEFIVRDLIAPVVKCDDEIRVSLSNTYWNETGYGKITAEDVDEGSWDNCGRLNWLRVRRVVPQACQASFLNEYDTNGNGRLDPIASNGDWSGADGFDLNGDGKLNGFGETFVLKDGKLLTPLRPYIEFFCCDLSAAVTVELWAEDQSGNRSYCWMNVSVEDKTAPSCVAPADRNIYCDDKCLGSLQDRAASSACYGDVTIYGGNDCTNLNVVYSVEDKVKCGKGYIIRRWTINKGAQSTSCEQRINVLPITEYDICFPKDATANCKSVKADAAFAVALGCDAPAINVSDKRYEATDGECYKIFRTYTVVNWCAYDDRCGDPMGSGKVYVVERNVLGNNNGKDPIYVLVRDKNRDGDEEFWLSKNRIPEETADVQITPPICVATDDYYHSFMYTQIIKVEDPGRPVVSVPQLSVFPLRATDCLADVSITFRATDSCSANLELEIPQLMVAPNRTQTGPFIMYSASRWTAKTNADGSFTVGVKNLPEGKHDLIVLVRDGCGNLSVPTRIPFEVKDQKAPAPICIKGLSLSLMSDQQGGGTMAVWATDFVASAIYDCNGQGEVNAQGLKRITKYSINRKGGTVDMAQNSLVLDCNDKGKQIEVELHAWDEAMNHDFCTTFIDVQDNNRVCPGAIVEPVAISGYVATAQNNMVKGVALQLSGGAVMQYTSGADGTYNFAGLTKGKTYTLTPDLNKEFGNGITTLDLIYIQKHLINLQSITDPYLMIAADVDNSGHISIGDQIRLRKFILNMIPDFGGTKSWRFVDQAYRFPDPSNPWKEAFPEAISMTNLDHDTKANFVAIKVGDLNQSATVSGVQTPELRNAEMFKLFLGDLNLEAGNTYEVPVTASDLTKLAGYQFALNWQPQSIELLGIKNGIARNENFALFVEQGLLTTSWIEQGQAKNGPLFTLVIKAKTNSQLSRVLQLNSKVMPAEAYNHESEVLNLALDFRAETMEMGEEMILGQNQPNPFRNETQIGFWLPQKGETILSIHDVTGRRVKILRQSYDKGYHHVLIKHSDLPSNGVYYYTLTQHGATATRKMVLTK